MTTYTHHFQTSPNLDFLNEWAAALNTTMWLPHDFFTDVKLKACAVSAQKAEVVLLTEMAWLLGCQHGNITIFFLHCVFQGSNSSFICWFFSCLISKSIKCTKIVQNAHHNFPKPKKKTIFKCLLLSKPTVQDPNSLHLLILTTTVKSKCSHLRSWKQQMLTHMLEKLLIHQFTNRCSSNLGVNGAH